MHRFVSCGAVCALFVVAFPGCTHFWDLVTAQDAQADGGVDALADAPRAIESRNDDVSMHPDAPAPIGTPCSAGSTCDSGFCSDGFCCTTACDGACDTCSAASGATANGTCTLLGPSVVCRLVDRECDVPETCNGTDAACPPDQFAAATTVCRPSRGVCDPAENCTGTTAACPADTFAAGTVACRNATSACDVTEYCTGTGATCPADRLVADGSACSGADPLDACCAGVCTSLVADGNCGTCRNACGSLHHCAGGGGVYACVPD